MKVSKARIGGPGGSTPVVTATSTEMGGEMHPFWALSAEEQGEILPNLRSVLQWLPISVEEEQSLWEEVMDVVKANNHVVGVITVDGIKWVIVAPKEADPEETGGLV